MFIGRSPLRISFAGGGTDLEEYHNKFWKIHHQNKDMSKNKNTKNENGNENGNEHQLLPLHLLIFLFHPSLNNFYCF